ncbi:hypothetical protein EV137_0119 [Kribbella pratensis]|uniref:Uncharacterized protein n=1 Tax=Kribbella pratensis TaxID=2512112 RepID=A0ABY2FIW3_9ACTN|nr:hypothetical protein EV137_0119 [Kribbella pratensis]
MVRAADFERRIDGGARSTLAGWGAVDLHELALTYQHAQRTLKWKSSRWPTVWMSTVPRRDTQP